MADNKYGWLGLLMKRLQEYDVPDIQALETAWNILTTLRGPDIDWDKSGDIDVMKLKTLTTARIRGILGVSSSVGFVSTFILSSDDIDDRAELLLKFKEKYGDHFESHLKLAYESLKVLGYDVPQEEVESLT